MKIRLKYSKYGVTTVENENKEHLIQAGENKITLTEVEWRGLVSIIKEIYQFTGRSL